MYKTTAKHRHNHKNYDFYSDLEKIRDAFADTGSNLKGKATSMLSETYDDAMDKSTEFQTKVTRYVNKKPFKALGWAALAGVLAGFWLRK